MARAKRHYIPGQIWHITHRCHKREFLLKFAKDRRRWLQWLFEAKKRYGLEVLNYSVTSNHIHLLVVDGKDRKAIPNSIQLIAGRTGQEFNQRKGRKGAFWEDRYHATAVEDGDHLSQCIVYIDLNMVRAGVVSHPSEWPFCGYNEIQEPRRKNVLINYDRLRQLLGFDAYDGLKASHKGWVESFLNNGENRRNDKWTRSIAVGSKNFIRNIKTAMGVMAKGRKNVESGESYQLREPQIPYGNFFEAQKSAIDTENTCFWELNYNDSRR
ncbi:MAG: transposase [Desulfobacteraceae bacterium]|nr:MAG: transposase [Desulfobacteraceae bacterium]